MKTGVWESSKADYKPAPRILQTVRPFGGYFPTEPPALTDIRKGTGTMSFPTTVWQFFGLLAGVLAGSASQADADMVAFWDFNSLTENGTEAYGHNPSAGAGFVRVDPAWQRDFDGVNRGITAFPGSLNNAQNAAPAGLALTLQGGTDEDNTPGSPPNNGKWLQVEADLSAYINPIVSLAIFRSFNTAGGFNNNQLSWSTDGTTFTDVGASFDPDVNFDTRTFDLSAINQLDGAVQAFFRITFGGATTNGGHNRIDNILLAATPIPEPGLPGMLLVAGLLGKTTARRRTRE